MWQFVLTLFIWHELFWTVSLGGGGGGALWLPHHNFVVVVPMNMKFGTDMKLVEFYTAVQNIWDVTAIT